MFFWFFFILGYGIFVTKDISPFSFLCEYPGEIITEEERDKRESNYETEGLGSYLFDIEYEKEMY